MYIASLFFSALCECGEEKDTIKQMAGEFFCPEVTAVIIIICLFLKEIISNDIEI